MSPSTLTSPVAADPALQVNLRRVLRASRQRVFEAWTQPEQMRQWRSPVGWTVPYVQADVRPGGHYRMGMRGTPPAAPGETPQEREGSISGEFLEIVPPELIRFTYVADWMRDGEMIVTVRLTEVPEGTLLELTQETFPTVEDARNHSAGWNGALDKLDALLARPA